jgi:excinuclease ABC subunit A
MNQKIQEDKIVIKGARQNNLKNIDVEIPKNKLVVITGLSGSGKSSLAFDIIYAEGYRRYVENLSAQARFFLNDVKKPEFDQIDNLAPTIAIDQRRDAKNPRSTVGTVLGVYDFLRILYAELGEVYCPSCKIPLSKKDDKEMLEYIKNLPKDTEVYILAPWETTGDPFKQLNNIGNQGYSKVRMDGKIAQVATLLAKKKLPKKQIDVVVDRINVDKKRFDRERVVDSLQVASKLSKTDAVVSVEGEQDTRYSKGHHCSKCGFELQKLKVKNFSFNSPEGACDKCSGLGEVFQADFNKIIPNKKLSINEGGIVPWSRLGKTGESGRRKAILTALAKKYKFNLDKPISKIPKKILDKIVWGEEGLLEINDEDGSKKISFIGVAHELEEKYNNKQGSSGELERYLTKKLCPVCEGKRLKAEFLAVKVFDKTIDELTFMEIEELVDFFKKIQKNKDEEKYKNDKEVAEKLVGEILFRIKPIQNVGVDYLNLNRAVNTLSGGEFQRLRLSTQLQNGLSNLIYVLDEPSVGLHSKDIKNLIGVLRQICNNGNTVIVVEHDRDIIKKADYIIDIGPGAGSEGGKVVFAGTLEELKKSKTETAKYLFNEKKCRAKNKGGKIKLKKSTKKIIIRGAQEHNLKNIDVEIPLQKLVSVTGASGGGKSSLIIDILAKGLKRKLNGNLEEPGKHKNIIGVSKLAKVVIVNQSPIGRSPRSNAATYTGIFSHIRSVFADTELARKKNLNDGYFSFNMKGGRCEYCQGDGMQKVEMHLLGGVYTECPHCEGTRYNKKVREIEYHGVSIVDVLDMSVEYAYHFFNSNKIITRKLQVLKDVGLGYLKLGQNATELSGGEAQRVKLATELIRQSNQGALYILDEPTVGLHFGDIERLLTMLKKLVEKGNSIIVVEHNFDMICESDWIIELGPGGGKKGGEIVFEGTPEDLLKAKTLTSKNL